MKKDKAKLAVVGVFFILVLSFASFGSPLTILPAEEGLNSGVYGWGSSLYSPLYSSKNPPVPPDVAYEAGYELVNDDPRNYIFGYWHDYWVNLWHGYERTDIRIETSQPWYELHSPVSYWVEEADGSLTLVEGEVWKYHVDVVFSIVNKNDPGVYVFQSDPVWFALTTVTWDRAIKDPVVNKKDGTAWGAPISVYIESYSVDETGKGDHYYIEPSLEGRFITLYSVPDSAGTTIDDLGTSSGANVNSSLGNTLSPDSRMQSTAYMRFILEDFGVTEHRDAFGSLVGRDYPTVRYRLKVYFLSIGKWTFTKSEAEQWGIRKGEEDRWRAWYDIGGMLSDWWNSLPLFTQITALFGILLVVAVVVIVVFVLAGGAPILLALLTGRRKG